MMVKKIKQQTQQWLKKSTEAVEPLVIHLLSLSNLMPSVVKQKIINMGQFPGHYQQIDPDLKLMLMAKNKKKQTDYLSQSLDDDRLSLRRMTKVLPSQLTPVRGVADLYTSRPDGTFLTLRHYRSLNPNHVDKTGLILYFHGGGYIAGDLDTVDEPCRLLSYYSGCGVLSVNYRLAPENSLKASLDDALMAYRYVHDNAEELHVDLEKLVIMGDSAGGHLAIRLGHALIEKANDRSWKKPFLQVPIYPWIDWLNTYPSHQLYSKGLMLSIEDVYKAYDYLCGDDSALRHSMSFMQKEATLLAQSPKTLLVTAEFDVLRDEGKAYAERLQEVGVDCDYLPIAGQCHGFVNMSHLNRAAHYATVMIAKKVQYMMMD